MRRSDSADFRYRQRQDYPPPPWQPVQHMEVTAGDHLPDIGHRVGLSQYLFVRT